MANPRIFHKTNAPGIYHTCRLTIYRYEVTPKFRFSQDLKFEKKISRISQDVIIHDHLNCDSNWHTQWGSMITCCKSSICDHGARSSTVRLNDKVCMSEVRITRHDFECEGYSDSDHDGRMCVVSPRGCCSVLSRHRDIIFRSNVSVICHYTNSRSTRFQKLTGHGVM